MNQIFSSRPAIYHRPMSQEDFHAAQITAYQQAQLQPDVVREQIRNGQMMAREECKSRMRQQEVVQRQLAKQKYYQIFVENNCVQLQIVSGVNIVLAKKCLFRCRVTQLRCFRFAEEDGWYWQVSLIEQESSSEITSPLYSSYLLTSPSKLRDTILNNYICVYDRDSCSQAWTWMYNQLKPLYEKADVIELPSKAGWFQRKKQWRFWTNCEDSFLLSDHVEKFSFDRFENLNAEETISSFVEAAFGISDNSSIPVLWIFRMAALLGRLTGAVPLGIGLTIVGEQSSAVAKKFLRVMQNDVDTANLDSCRLTEVKKLVITLQDSPFILISANPNCRSTQKRILEVQSWMETGFVGSDKILIPFVFCINKFAKEYPLDSTIIIDERQLKKIDVSEHFSKFQSLIISTVENSGVYWVDELKNEYARQAKNEKATIALYKTVDKIVLSMFEKDLNYTTQLKLKRLIRLGEEEIERQLNLKYTSLLEVFCAAVNRSVHEKKLYVVDRNEHSKNLNTTSIYCDNMFYYFSRNVFDLICQKGNIDSKTELAIKQQLIEREFLKVYKSTGTSNRELEIDFTVWGANDKKINLSGIAIKREFFDELGGVSLAERGAQNEA